MDGWTSFKRDNKKDNLLSTTKTENCGETWSSMSVKGMEYLRRRTINNQ